jgi:GDSL-like Lipase/Acylhydrolase
MQARLGRVAAAAVLALLAGGATCQQNTFVTITRSGATATYRVVAFGDSIYAGYDKSLSLSSVARRSDPYVVGDYLASQWNANIDVVRLTESGATASQILADEINGYGSSYINANTRVVMLDSCGNDFLQARTSIEGQSGTCNYSVLTTAVSNCVNNTRSSLSKLNALVAGVSGLSGKTVTKLLMNLYYPGFASDNTALGCTVNGVKPNRQQVFLDYLAQANFELCGSAEAAGFQCVDDFSNYMAADYDTDGDGTIDQLQIAYRGQAEGEAAYRARINGYRTSIIRDSGTKGIVNASGAHATADYLLTNDNTHPTYTGGTISCSSGSPSSSSHAQDYTASPNAVWNVYGHERGGWQNRTLLAGVSP